MLDGQRVKLEIDDLDPCSIYITNLKQHTDEIYIREALKDYGDIKSV